MLVASADVGCRFLPRRSRHEALQRRQMRQTACARLRPGRIANVPAQSNSPPLSPRPVWVVAFRSGLQCQRNRAVWRASAATSSHMRRDRTLGAAGPWQARSTHDADTNGSIRPGCWRYPTERHAAGHGALHAASAEAAGSVNHSLRRRAASRCRRAFGSTRIQPDTGRSPQQPPRHELALRLRIQGRRPVADVASKQPHEPHRTRHEGWPQRYRSETGSTGD